MSGIAAYQRLAGPNQVWSPFNKGDIDINKRLMALNSTMDDNTYNSVMLEMIDNTKGIIDKQFIDNGSIKSYKNTEDYKKHRLIPGQRLATGNAFGIEGTGLAHHVVYIGNGLIYEMAPLSENKDLRKGFNIKLGMSNLYNWINAANEKGDPVFMIEDKDVNIDNKDFMIGMFKRLNEKIVSGARANQYGPFNNCESEANYITRGKQETYQGNIILRTIAVGAIGAYGIPTLVPDEKCYARYVTENDNPCMNGAENQLISGYCIVDPKSKNFRREKTLDPSNNNLRQGKIKKKNGKLTKRRYKLNKDKMKQCPGEDILEGDDGFLVKAYKYFTGSIKKRKNKKNTRRIKRKPKSKMKPKKNKKSKTKPKKNNKSKSKPKNNLTQY